MRRVSLGFAAALLAGCSQHATSPSSSAPPPPGTTTYTLSATAVGLGRVVSVPVGIDCGASCSASYPSGTVVQLAAAPNSGWHLSQWQGNCSGSGACSVTMLGPRAVTAVFEADTVPPPPGAPVGLWLKGDSHVHDDHSSDGSDLRQTIDQGSPGVVSIADQIQQGTLLGLDFLPLTDHRTYDQHYDPLWESANLVLIPGEEANGSPHAIVHGGVDSIVQGGSPAGSPGFRRLQTSIWDAHAQDANWDTAHPDDGERNDDGTPNDNANAVGVDNIEVWNRASVPDSEIDYAENRWNAGFRTGVVGACDDHFRTVWPLAGPGMPTTQVFAADASEPAIVQALRAGRTAVNAPLLAPFATLEADLQGDGVYEAWGGDELIAPAGTHGKLRIRVTLGLDDTVLLYKSPGRSAGPFMTFKPASPELMSEYLVDIVAEAAPTWYRVEVRGFGDPDHYDISSLPLSLLPSPSELPDQLRAVTAPVFISAAPVNAAPAVAVPDDAGSDDGAALVIGSTGSFSGFPDVAMAGGVAHVVAEQHDGAAYHVTYRRRAADGTLSAPFDLAPASKSARFPKVAASGSKVWAVWQDSREGEQPHRRAIYLRQSTDGGTTWGAETKLSNADGRAEHPDVAVTADGKAFVVWQQISAGNPFDVMAQVVSRDSAPVNLSNEGKTVMAANAVDTRSARYPASVWPVAAVAPDGTLAVAWQDNRTDVDPLWTGALGAGDGTDPDNWQIMVRTQPAAGGAWSAPSSIGADDHSDRHPALAFAGDGTLVAAWDSKTLDSSGANLAVLAATSSDQGAHWSTPAAISADSDHMSEYPKLARDSGGAVRAAWYDSRSADWRWRVMTAMLSGAGWNAATLINSPGINTWPALDSGTLVFASTRNAARLQRDRTQEIYWMTAP